VRAAPVLAATV
jgi:hypothetical protein